MNFFGYILNTEIIEIHINDKNKNESSELIEKENKIYISVYFDNLTKENIIFCKEKEKYICYLSHNQINENIIKIEIYKEKEKYLEYNNSIINIKNAIITLILNQNEYIKIKFQVDKNLSHTSLKKYLYLPYNSNIDYQKIIINIYKLNLKNINSLEFYNLLFKYDDENYLYTNKEFNINSKNIDISSSVIFNIPDIDIYNINISLLKNDNLIEKKELNLRDIRNNIYNELQYLEFGDCNLLFNIEEILINQKEKFPYCKCIPLSKKKLTFAKEKGKNHIWNINLSFYEIYTLPKNITNTNNLNCELIIIFNGNTYESNDFFSKKNFEFQSLNDKISEIPNIKISLKYKELIFEGIIKINENTSFTILSNNKIPLIIILQFHIEIIKKKISISLINNISKSKNTHEDSLCSFDSISQNKNSTDCESEKILNYKSYFGILTLYNFEYNNNKLNQLSISLNSFTHFLFNINENFIEKNFLFHNIRFDYSNPKTYPLLTFCSINSENKFSYKSYKLNKEHLNNKNWFLVNDEDKILFLIELIEENNINQFQNQINLSNNIPKEYIIDSIFIGYRDYNNCNDYKLYINKPNILINLNSINNNNSNYIKKYKSDIKEKGNNSNFLLSIYENISLKLNNEIYLNCYHYDNNILFGLSKINIEKIINNSEIILNERINLIKEICGKEEDEINTNKDIKLQIKKTKSIKTDDFVIFPEFIDYSIPGTFENEQYYQSYKIEDLHSIPNLSDYKVLYPYNIKIKHYRRFYDYVLENKNALNLHSPFINIRVNPINNLFLKTLIQIVKKEQLNQLKLMLDSINNTSNISYVKELSFLNFFDDIKKNILIEKKVIVKIFITEINLIQQIKDYYLKIFIGGELKYNSDEDNKNDNIAIKINMPSNSLLKFEIWEKNKYEGNKILCYSIDENIIDLENRFYNYKWRNIQYKPIEKIILSNNNFSKEEIGNIYLWIDIEELEKEKEDLEKEQKLIEDEEKTIKINLDNLPNPIKLNNINLINDNNNFQIRCIVYDIEYIDAINSVNKTKNDLFIISKISNSNPQFSDIHYNCNGYGYFNWRFIFDIPFSSNSKYNNINFSICDNNINNIELCSGNFDYNDILNISNNLNLPIIYSKKFHEEITKDKKSEIVFEDSKNFWINLYNTNVIKGRIKINFEIIPMEIAKNWVIGKGRNDPNINPYLPYPIGRIKWVSTPFNFIKNLIPNDRIRKKICSLIICTFILFYLIFLIPYVIYHLIGEVSNPFNYLIYNKVKRK